jgi:hypothetical protein
MIGNVNSAPPNGPLTIISQTRCDKWALFCTTFYFYYFITYEDFCEIKNIIWCEKRGRPLRGLVTPLPAEAARITNNTSKSFDKFCIVRCPGVILFFKGLYLRFGHVPQVEEISG